MGDGSISISELIHAVKKHEQTAAHANYLKFVVVILVVGVLVLCGCMFGLTVLALEMTKEVHVNQAGMLAGDDQRVLSTGAATSEGSLSNLLEYDASQLMALDGLQLPMEGEEWSFHKVASVH